MRIWMAVLLVYMIARKWNWKISEWLEIILACMLLFILFHI